MKLHMQTPHESRMCLEKLSPRGVFVPLGQPRSSLIPFPALIHPAIVSCCLRERIPKVFGKFISKHMRVCNNIIFSFRSWGKWDGGAENIYAAQKYENGQNCWNGPNRSVKVREITSNF